MTQQTKKQLKAVGKMAFGTAKMASGVATGLGVGLLGGFLRAQNQPWVRHRIGALSFQGGLKMFSEGLKALKG